MRRPFGFFLALLCTGALAQAQAPTIFKIDPPNWYAALPAPTLLVHGENLTGSTWTLSNPALRISTQKVSPNGHWAELTLEASPSEPETVQIATAGPHGRTVAPFRFDQRRAANDVAAGFSSRDVMYLIMTDRFADGDPTNDGPDRAAELAKPRGWHGGDLRGVTEHLDYLQDLGVTTVWLTPVYANAGEPESYHGYGATDMYAVDPHFGSLADLRQLSSGLHRRHMKLVLDTVPNHVGAKHPWVADEPEPDWFHGTPAHHLPSGGGFEPLADPHADPQTQKAILEGWFADSLPDMNQENPTVARYLIQNVAWWLEQTGADGLRIDTFAYVGRPFWRDFHAQLRALYPHLTDVGEVFDKDPIVVSAWAGGVVRNDLDGDVDTGLWTPFDFPAYFTLRDVLLHDKPMTEWAKHLAADSLYPHPERLVPHLGNHDTKRFLSEDGATPEKLKEAFALLLTMRGMPQLYAGDEIAMQGGDDPDNRRDFPGGFPGGGQNAFVPARRTPAQRDMHDWVQRLLTLRAQYPELNSGDERMLFADETTAVYIRGANLQAGCAAGQGRMLVAVNKGSAGAVVPLAAKEALDRCTAQPPAVGQASVSASTLTVPPGALLVYWK